MSELGDGSGRLEEKHMRSPRSTCSIDMASQPDLATEILAEQYRRCQEVAELAEIFGDDLGLTSTNAAPDIAAVEEICGGNEVQPVVSDGERAESTDSKHAA